MPRFVILRHDSPRGLHYDFMLESGEVLKTWALPELLVPGVELIAERLPDHRRAYLDYEGPVSGNRGTVERCDQGQYETIADDVVAEDIACLSVTLHGETLSANLLIERIPTQPSMYRIQVRRPEAKRQQ